MKNEIISQEELKKMLHIGEDRTIDSYIRQGILPEPTKNVDDDCFFSRSQVYKILGLKSDPNEDFVTSKDLVGILGLTDKKFVKPYVNRRKLPYYTLKNSKGTHTYYLMSEIKSALSYQAKWGNDFPNMVAKNTFLHNMLDNFINDNTVSTLDIKKRMILVGVILKGKSFNELAEQLGYSVQSVSRDFSIACKRVFSSVKTWTQKVNNHDKLFEENLKLRATHDVLLKKLETNTPVTISDNAEINSLGTPIDTLFFSSRTINLCILLDINCLGNFTNIQKSYLTKMRNVGRVTIEEIEGQLKQHGLWWKPETEKQK